MEQPSHLAVIFLPVRPRLVSLVPALAAVAISAATAASAASAATPSKHKKTHHKKGPTAEQKIQAAVASAEHSPDLWATVNVCTSSTTGDTVGIRGQMPSIGVSATLSMNISVSYWNGTAFTPANASQSISLGQGTHGLHQGGVNFPFSPPNAGSTFVVRGTITFTWTVGSKVVGKVTRNTGHGYPNVNFSNPPGYSAGTCTLT